MPARPDIGTDMAVELMTGSDNYWLLRASSESPRVQKAAPRRTTSFKRNPPEPESAGKPPRLFSQPGSENKNVSVDRKVNTARTLPITESFAESGRIAISTAAVISTTPMMFEVACRLNTLYIQLISGLVATNA